MRNDIIDVEAVDTIFDSMVRTMDQSRNDIFLISEQSREHFEDIKKELESIKKTKEVVNSLQLELSVNQIEERQLCNRKSELERRLVLLLETIERADQLVNQITVVTNYLTSDLKDVGRTLETTKQKQSFTNRIIEAQEEERKRLSRDIHDGPAQMLANVLLRTGLIEKVFRGQDSASALKELKELKESVKGALIEVRRVIFDLRPMALDELGLIPALKKYLSKVERFEENIEIQFQSIGNEQRFSASIEIAVFRLVQESITNAIKHGKPTSVLVEVEWLQGLLNVVVKDNGHGFDINEVKEKSFGLIGMRERIDLLKADMKIKSTVDQGTTILFIIPLKNEILEKENIGRK